MSNIDFPFNYLHNEIVRYLKERDVEVRQEKEEWLKNAKQGEFAGIFNGEKGTALRNRIFAQGSPETTLESMGRRVGYILVQKASRDIPLLTNELDVMKFICKEFWLMAFNKNVDNLRTNHQGVYILQDNRFHTVSALSDGTQYLKESLIYLAYPVGIIRGALENFGINSIVTAQVERLPVVKFQITINKK